MTPTTMTPPAPDGSTINVRALFRASGILGAEGLFPACSPPERARLVAAALDAAQVVGAVPTNQFGSPEPDRWLNAVWRHVRAVTCGDKGEPFEQVVARPQNGAQPLATLFEVLGTAAARRANLEAELAALAGLPTLPPAIVALGRRA